MKLVRRIRKNPMTQKTRSLSKFTKLEPLKIVSTPLTKIAIVQVADTGPLESLVYMLRSAGYKCYTPNAALRSELKSIGCDTVLDIQTLVSQWGYEEPFAIPEASPSQMKVADLFVDIKAHRTYHLITQRWPNLTNKVLWYRINGGKPEHVIRADGFDCGDEANPPCPVLTPNQWYKETEIEDKSISHKEMVDPGECIIGGEFLTPGRNLKPAPWKDKAYCCWPPFVRMSEYIPSNRNDGSTKDKFHHPITLIHKPTGWGYGKMFPLVRELGVRIHGLGAPDGLINHSEIKLRLEKALAMVHLKSNDAPGYALYESLAAGCPVILPGRMIWRCRMESLFSPGKNCLTFDNRLHHEELTNDQCEEDFGTIAKHLGALSNPEFNQYIGLNGRKTLESLVWNPEKESDLESLRIFMLNHFGK